ncbi:MAG: hypothetical protein WC905_00020 [Patescibacteria group bacterium]|jgi:hypothetical protein
MPNECPTSSFDLEKAISRLIAFFDLFEYPLTPWEVWHYLDERFRLSDIMAALDRLAGSGATAQEAAIGHQAGFYFLRGREKTITTRQQRHNYSQRKINIAKRFGRLFSWLPAVKVVAVANSLGGYNLRDGSDIDFFIITAAGRIWLSRLFCTGLAKILNRRPTARHKRDRICLSFYLADDHLALSELALPGFDPYFHYWQRSLIVLYNKDRKYQAFLAANRLPGGQAAKAVKNSGHLANHWEKMAKRWQLKIMPVALLSQNGGTGGVVLGDSIIKLYLSDRRLEFSKKYEEKIQVLA